MLLINRIALRYAQVWLLSEEGCVDGNHTVTQLAGFSLFDILVLKIFLLRLLMAHPCRPLLDSVARE